MGNWLAGIGGNGGRKAALTELAVDFARLFVVRSRETAHAPYPFESVYETDERRMMGAARDDVRRCYRAAGFGTAGDWNVGEDHIALELEFAAQLASSGNVAAFDEFRARHLTPWVGRFAADMEACARTDFYRGVARSLADLFA